MNRYSLFLNIEGELIKRIGFCSRNFRFYHTSKVNLSVRLDLTIYNLLVGWDVTFKTGMFPVQNQLGARPVLEISVRNAVTNIELVRLSR